MICNRSLLLGCSSCSPRRRPVLYFQPSRHRLVRVRVGVGVRVTPISRDICTQVVEAVQRLRRLGWEYSSERREAPLVSPISTSSTPSRVDAANGASAILMGPLHTSSRGCGPYIALLIEGVHRYRSYMAPTQVAEAVAPLDRRLHFYCCS